MIKLKYKFLFTYFLLVIITKFSLYAQSKYVRGVVLEETQKGKFIPIVGAPVIWLGTSDGTVTDTNGVFKLPVSEHILMGHSEAKLMISYIGFKSDTLDVKNTDLIRVVLSQSGSKELQEVEITERINSSYINALEPLNTKTMSEKELFKAACCNLSESFETNPSVDVSFADAVSGAKQIQMLGLSGIYTQMTNENLPGTRGLAANFGLGFIPGPWVESIQVTKGVGSVANGYESMAGQINVELKKPDITPKTGERVYVNAYVNDFGRYEANLNYTQKISPKWATTTLLHANTQQGKIDQNGDGFLDIPLGTQFNGISRWKYDNNGWMLQFGVKALKDNRIGGQTDYNEATDKGTTNRYGLGLNTERIEGFTKIGYIFPQKKYKSVGFMASVLNHSNDNYYGLTKYKANQQSIYANLIYQSIIGNTIHKYRVGTSYLLENYNENFKTQLFNPSDLTFKRTESVVGAFAEYTWTPIPQFTAIAGLRGDYHNLFGFFLTPRIHAKYDITENTQIRVSAGRGQRTANILAENTSVFASSRQVVITPSAFGSSGSAYGLRPEIAWNYGISLSQVFRLDNRKGNFTVDFYRTDFQNQVVVDYDKNPQQINFYNLSGSSYSNSVQAEIDYELFKRFDIRLAYRFYDVNTTYSDALLQRPLISRDRAFINLAYETKSKFKFDYTLNWNGTKRIPNTALNPTIYRKNTNSPDYFMMNAQVSKSFGDTQKNWWDIYVGVENILDFRQNDLIIASESPFNPYFDTSLIWGPVIGRMIYGGVRYKLK